MVFFSYFIFGTTQIYFTDECCFSTDYVQDLKFTPTHHEVFPGDVIKCSANGNPAPSIELQPATGDSGSGWKSFVVGSEHSGKELNVLCTASNTLNDVTETITKNLTYHVLGE